MTARLHILSSNYFLHIIRHDVWYKLFTVHTYEYINALVKIEVFVRNEANVVYSMLRCVWLLRSKRLVIATFLTIVEESLLPRAPWPFSEWLAIFQTTMFPKVQKVQKSFILFTLTNRPIDVPSTECLGPLLYNEWAFCASGCHYISRSSYLYYPNSNIPLNV